VNAAKGLHTTTLRVINGFVRAATTAALVLSFQLAVIATDGQDRGEVASSIESAQARVVFPSSFKVDPDEARELLVILENQAPVPGIPREVLEGVRVTISLVPNARMDLDAWNFPREAVIAMPAEKALSWEPRKLHRVVRHELAHIALSRHLGERTAPVWFREGFAECAAGGLSCEQKTRLQMNLLLQRAQQGELPELRTSPSSSASRREYDLFASFFEFLEVNSPGIVASGALLAAVKEHGVSTGSQRAYGRTIDELEQDWRAYLLEEYVEADVLECGASDGH